MLRGKKAVGRVACVDDGDYDLVMHYRWYVKETAPRPGNRGIGPYALAVFKIDPLARVAPDGHSHSLLMHKLITGWPKTDHIDHYGLNTQRSNLRDTTDQQNLFNRRGSIDTSSRYKGVSWCKRKRLWRVHIKVSGKSFPLGSFSSETAAAMAYDAAAREKHGAFACLNFPDGVMQALLEQVNAEREAAGIFHVCTICGARFERRRRGSLYCGKECGTRGQALKDKQRYEREREGRLS